MNGDIIKERASFSIRRGTLGMTLVELLVVIVLVTTLVTTAIPVLSPGGDGRKLREASRNINAYFAGAQARAIETGRPFGVALHRLSGDSNNAQDNGVCVRLSYVEVPPPFAGLDENEVARVCDNLQLNQLQLQFLRYRDEGARTAGLPPGYQTGLIPGSFLKPGDIVEFNGQRLELTSNQFTNLDDEGFYEPSIGGNGVFILPFVVEEAITDIASQGFNNQRTVTFNYHPVIDSNGEALSSPENIDTNNAGNLRFWSTPTPYKIYRQPVPAAGEPLQLPNGIAIDLQASGLMNGDPFYRPDAAAISSGQEERVDPNEIYILFSPEGGVSRVYSPDYSESPSPPGALSNVPPRTSQMVSESIALCVGRRELIPGEIATSNRQTLGADQPFDPQLDVANLSEEEIEEVYSKYNWLNPDTRWVVLGSQSGHISTVENTVLTLRDDDGDGRFDVDRDGQDGLTLREQLAYARQYSKARISSGGR